MAGLDHDDKGSCRRARFQRVRCQTVSVSVSALEVVSGLGPGRRCPQDARGPGAGVWLEWMISRRSQLRVNSIERFDRSRRERRSCWRRYSSTSSRRSGRRGRTRRTPRTSGREGDMAASAESRVPRSRCRSHRLGLIVQLVADGSDAAAQALGLARDRRVAQLARGVLKAFAALPRPLEDSRFDDDDRQIQLAA